MYEIMGNEESFFEKYSYMYYFLWLWDINSKIITVWLQERNNNDCKNVLIDRIPDKDYMKMYWDTFFYTENFTQFSGWKSYNYIENIKSLLTWIKELKDKDFFNTDIEPFPKEKNTQDLNNFYKDCWISDNNIKNNNHWDFRIKKIKELLKWKIVLISGYYPNSNNLILDNLDIVDYEKQIFEYEKSLYIQVKHFSFLEWEELDKTILNIKNNELFKDFIKNINAQYTTKIN